MPSPSRTRYVDPPSVLGTVPTDALYPSSSSGPFRSTSSNEFTVNLGSLIDFSHLQETMGFMVTQLQRHSECIQKLQVEALEIPKLHRLIALNRANTVSRFYKLWKISQEREGTMAFRRHRARCMAKRAKWNKAVRHWSRVWRGRCFFEWSQFASRQARNRRVMEKYAAVIADRRFSLAMDTWDVYCRRQRRHRRLVARGLLNICVNVLRRWKNSFERMKRIRRWMHRMATVRGLSLEWTTYSAWRKYILQLHRRRRKVNWLQTLRGRRTALIICDRWWIRTAQMAALRRLSEDCKKSSYRRALHAAMVVWEQVVHDQVMDRMLEVTAIVAGSEMETKLEQTRLTLARRISRRITDVAIDDMAMTIDLQKAVRWARDFADLHAGILATQLSRKMDAPTTEQLESVKFLKGGRYASSSGDGGDASGRVLPILDSGMSKDWQTELAERRAARQRAQHRLKYSKEYAALLEQQADEARKDGGFLPTDRPSQDFDDFLLNRTLQASLGIRDSFDDDGQVQDPEIARALAEKRLRAREYEEVKNRDQVLAAATLARAEARAAEAAVVEAEALEAAILAAADQEADAVLAAAASTAKSNATTPRTRQSTPKQSSEPHDYLYDVKHKLTGDTEMESDKRIREVCVDPPTSRPSLTHAREEVRRMREDLEKEALLRQGGYRA